MPKSAGPDRSTMASPWLVWQRRPAHSANPITQAVVIIAKMYVNLDIFRSYDSATSVLASSPLEVPESGQIGVCRLTMVGGGA